jgi:RNA polymerase sigma factor (sigma-70 family)
MITQKQLLDRYPLIKGLARGVSVNGWDVEDLAQEAFLHVLSRGQAGDFEKLRERSGRSGKVKSIDISAWVLSLAKNKLFDIRRHVMHKGGGYRENTNTVSNSNFMDKDSQRLIDEQQQDQEATKALLDELREVAESFGSDESKLLEMMVLGVSSSEMAAKFKIPVPTLLMRTSRLREKLRRAVSE